MTDEFAQLPPPEKKVAAKILYRMGWGSRKIEEWLDVSDSSVVRYKDEATPDDLKQFEADFEAAVKDLKQEGIARVYKRILELVPRERRIDQVVRAGEYLESISRAKTQVNVLSKAEVNNGITLMSDEELANHIYKMVKKLDPSAVEGETIPQYTPSDSLSNQ